ncbi:MAG: LLM class F420-dependent oxidoreductase [Candidatus Thorarchaeota archaeon]|nr:MAG: LLM class F420-dependent oxidoreductase [Candidatus Thorarchaeota archaeon]
MKIGLQLPRFHWPGNPENIGKKLAEIASTADDSGFSSLWVMDHLFQLGGGYGNYDEPMLEAYSLLSYLAAVTSKVKLGTLVTGSINRNPGMLIKIVTNLDVLSGGRAYLGIGAGWYKRECRGFGIPFPADVNELMGRFRENLKIAKHMWSGSDSPFEGKYYRLEEPLCRPMPVSKPHPPILIGGGGEKTMLKLVAQYGDAWNWHLGAHPKAPGHSEHSYNNYRTRFERIGRLISVLKEHCKNENRDFDEIEITLLSPIELSENVMTPEDVLEICEEMAGIGVHHLIFNMPNDHEIEPIRTIGEKIIPKVKSL